MSRPDIHSDPSRSMSVNKINLTRKVCKRMYWADIARTPYWSSYRGNMNIQRKCTKINSFDGHVNKCDGLIKGRQM